MKTRVCWDMTLVVVLITMLSLSAWAVPQQINYQGKLTDQYGDPVTDGNYEMTFTMYDGMGTWLWAETQTVTVTGGIYTVQIGQDPVGYPFPADLFEGERYLGVKVGTDPEMSPRQPLTSVPFAMRAEMAEGVVDSAVDTVHIVDSAVTEGKVAQSAITTGKVAANAITGEKIVDGTVTAADISGGSGSGLDADRLDGLEASDFITGVNAGTGLVGGGTSGDVTVDVQVPFLLSDSVSGGLIMGMNTSESTGFGVYGSTSGSSGIGVYGYASNTGNVYNYGGYFGNGHN